MIEDWPRSHLNVRFGSLADMLGCMKESPLYPLKAGPTGMVASNVLRFGAARTYGVDLWI